MQPGVQRMTSRARAWPRPWAPARLPKGVARLSLVLMAVVLTAGACPAPPIESNDVDRARVDALLASDPDLPATGVRLGGAGVGKGKRTELLGYNRASLLPKSFQWRISPCVV